MKDKENSINNTPINNNIAVKCDACDIESVFKNEKEAFLGGWMFKGVAAGLTICYCPSCAAESI